MQEGVVKAHPKADLQIAVVWVNVMPFDGMRAARKAARILSVDPRIRHFHDPQERVGAALSKTLKWEDEAWDIYVLYPKGVQWGAGAPKPEIYVHQLSMQSDGHFCNADELTGRLRKMVGDATSKK